MLCCSVRWMNGLIGGDRWCTQKVRFVNVLYMLLVMSDKINECNQDRESSGTPPSLDLLGRVHSKAASCYICYSQI